MIEVRLDSRAGEVVSTTPFTPTGPGDTTNIVTGKLDRAVSGRHDVYFFVMKHDKPYDEKIGLTEIVFKED